jgi:hypothetical protein
MARNARAVAADSSTTTGTTSSGIITSARTVIGPSTARENRSNASPRFLSTHPPRRESPEPTPRASPGPGYWEKGNPRAGAAVHRAGCGSAVVDGPPDAIMVGTGALPAAGHAVRGVVALHHVARPVVEVGDAVEVGADVRRRVPDEPATPAEVVAVRVGRRSAQRGCDRGPRRARRRRRPGCRRNHWGRGGRSGRCWPRRRRWRRRCQRGGGGSRRRGCGGGR